jgi:hypothetical protein
MKDTKGMDSETSERKDEPKALAPREKVLTDAHAYADKQGINYPLTPNYQAMIKAQIREAFYSGFESRDAELQSLRNQLKQREEEMRKAVHIVNEHRHNDLIERDNEIKELKEALREAMQYVGEGYDMLSGTDLEHIREEIELFRDKAKKLLENH